jgi:Domain of unknown function (DUF4129)
VNVAWPHGDPREVAQRILADRRFHTGPQEPPPKTWIDLVVDALKAMWHRLMDPLDHLVGNAGVSRAIGIAVLIAVAVGVVFVVVRYARNLRLRRTARTAPAAHALGEDADARTLLARALAAASAGRHHEAAALFWASALRALDEGGRVRYDAARTPGEWRRAVRDPDFDALARDAVVALFGDRGADAELVARMRAAYDRVVVPA